MQSCYSWWLKLLGLMTVSGSKYCQIYSMSSLSVRKNCLELNLVTAPNSSYGMVMFSQVSVNHSVHKGVASCLTAWPHVLSREYYVTSCLAAWSHVPSTGSPSRGGLPTGGGGSHYPLGTDIYWRPPKRAMRMLLVESEIETFRKYLSIILIQFARCR